MGINKNIWIASNIMIAMVFRLGHFAYIITLSSEKEFW